MKYLLIIIFALTIFPSWGDCRKVSITDRILLSESGALTLLYQVDGNCFKLLGGNVKELYKKIDGLEGVKDVPKQIFAQFSYDEKYLLIGFNVAESSRAYIVLSAIDLSLKDDFFATSATWHHNDNIIFYVPDYGVDEGQSRGGVIIRNIKDKSEKEILKNVYFSGELVSNGKIAIARAKVLSNMSPKDHVISVNLDLETYNIIE
jgi:hypothetical protein